MNERHDNVRARTWRLLSSGAWLIAWCGCVTLAGCTGYLNLRVGNRYRTAVAVYDTSTVPSGVYVGSVPAGGERIFRNAVIGKRYRYRLTIVSPNGKMLGQITSSGAAVYSAQRGRTWRVTVGPGPNGDDQPIAGPARSLPRPSGGEAHLTSE